MITDPITLGVTGHTNTFALTETGPGARTIRPTTSGSLNGSYMVFDGMTLTISHELNKKKDRRRSLVKLNFASALGLATYSPALVQPPFVQLVIDRPVDDVGGDIAFAAKELLSRLLGFLTANATGAPDHSFAAVPHIAELLRGEP